MTPIAATVAIVVYQIFLGSAFGFWGLLTISRSLPAITTNLLLMAVPVVGLALMTATGGLFPSKYWNRRTVPLRST